MMPTDYPQRRRDALTTIRPLREAAPELMRAYGDFGKQAYVAGALDQKTKELIALAISISKLCDGCIAFHAKGARAKGATCQEVVEAIAIAMQMGGGPAMVYGAEALAAFDQFSEQGASRDARASETA